MGRENLSDAEWELIGPLLPPELRRWARPAGGNWRVLNSIINVLRVGCPWRDMHEPWGKRNSVYVRFQRWAEQGVRATLLQTLVDLGLTDAWQHMIDSTSVRGHISEAGGKGAYWRSVPVAPAYPTSPAAHIAPLERQAASASALLTIP